MTQEDWVDGDRLTCLKCDNFVSELNSKGLCQTCRSEENEA